MKPSSFDCLAALLHAGSGLVIGPDKTYLLETRLGPLLKQHGLADIDALAARLRPGPAGSPQRPPTAVSCSISGRVKSNPWSITVNRSGRSGPVWVEA